MSVIITESNKKVLIERANHMLKNNSKVELPNNILFVDSEATLIKNRNKDIHNFKLVCCMYYMRIRNEYKRVESKHFWSIEEFHSYVDSLVRAKTKLYIVAHNFHYDFNILHFMQYITSRNYTIKKMSIDSQRFFINCNKEKHTIMFVDNTNFYKASIADLGLMIEKEKLSYDFNGKEDDDKLVEYCYRDVEILAESFIRLLKFIKDEDLGNFAITSASLAFNAFRHKFMKYRIYIHNNVNAIKLELDSYRGGLCDIFAKGKFQGKFYKIDVNSMYPYVMANNIFPTKLISVIEDFPVNKIDTIPKDYVWLAKCDMSITKPVLPLRYKHKLCLIKGNITNTITSTEYEQFKEYITINKIHKIAIYEAKPIFKEYVEYFYSKRLEAKKNKDNTNATFYKLLLNSLYGKFGQLIRERELVDVKELDAMLDECENNDNDINTINIISKIGDKYLVLKQYKISMNSFPAIASFVTAYARCYLMKLILKAGEYNTYYCDTDSLIVNEVGFNNLKEYIDDKELGKLKLEDEANEIEVIAPKWYIFNNKEVHKGIRKDAIQVSQNSWKQTKWNKTLTLWKNGYLNEVITEIYYVSHNGNYDKGIITDSGRIERYSVNELRKS